MKYRVVEEHFSNGDPYYIAQWKRYFFWNTYTKAILGIPFEFVRYFYTEQDAVVFIQKQKSYDTMKIMKSRMKRRKRRVVYTDSTDLPAIEKCPELVEDAREI